MAVKNNKFALPDDTMVEVVATKGPLVFKKQMKLGKAKKMKKEIGWSYFNYQISFSSMKENDIR